MGVPEEENAVPVGQWAYGAESFGTIVITSDDDNSTAPSLAQPSEGIAI